MTKEYVKNYKKEMEAIKEHTSKIDEIVSSLPSSSWKRSLEVTMLNFNRKLDGFLETSAELTADQRIAIAGIKSGKIPLSALSEYMGEKKPESSEKS